MPIGLRSCLNMFLDWDYHCELLSPFSISIQKLDMVIFLYLRPTYCLFLLHIIIFRNWLLHSKATTLPFQVKDCNTYTILLQGKSSLPCSAASWQSCLILQVLSPSYSRPRQMNNLCNLSVGYLHKDTQCWLTRKLCANSPAVENLVNRSD